MVTDFKSYKTSIPVLLTEFGCVNPSFPTVNKYEAQRTWLQAGWLHTKAFRDVFAGGFVFEYSTENANAKSESAFPFTSYGPQNYGLGYYSPANCDHDTVKCTYNPMPNYDSLKAQYTKVDTSDEPKMAKFTSASDRSSPPTCPPDFPTLASIAWDADKQKSIACPSKTLSFTCPSQKSSGVWTGATASDSAVAAPTTDSLESNTTASSETESETTTSSDTEGQEGGKTASSKALTPSDSGADAVAPVASGSSRLPPQQPSLLTIAVMAMGAALFI
jgi:hypothetical protein